MGASHLIRTMSPPGTKDPSPLDEQAVIGKAIDEVVSNAINSGAIVNTFRIAAKLKDAGLVTTIATKLEEARLRNAAEVKAPTIEDQIGQSAAAAVKAAMSGYQPMIGMDARALREQTLGRLPHPLLLMHLCMLTDRTYS